MKMLCAEQSTAISSLAVLDDHKILTEHSWKLEGNTSSELYQNIKLLLNDCKVSLDDIEQYCIGLGPGSYTNLRIAVSFINGLAVPHNIPIYGVPSINALAYDFFNNSSDKPVGVIGDARRKRFWLRFYPNKQDCMRYDRKNWQLLNIQQLSEFISIHSGVYISPDYYRIAGEIQAVNTKHIKFINTPQIPAAPMLGTLAGEMIKAKIKSLPLSPLYLNKPVSAKIE
jgi:tRNA threonylcarbamoyladenosine biosynthesis protein TsaB